MSQPSRIVVLGSNSFSGASFVAYALARGTEVVGASRSEEPASALLPYRWAPHDAFSFRRIDLNHDLDALMRIVTDFRPQWVVNFAAQSMVAESWKQPEHWFATNAVATVRLHERLRGCDFLERYVHISTPEVYGSCSGFVHETAPFNPSTPYAVSRAAADMSLHTFHAAYQFPVVTTRAANVYGPGQQLYRIVPRAILFALTGRKLQLHGGGHSQRAFIHIRDVSDATWRIAAGGVNGEAYHISTDEVISIRALVERIYARMGVGFADAAEVVGERLGKDAAYMLDSSKLKSTLGWHAQIALDAGIDECIAWVKQHLAELSTLSCDYQHKP
jgi:dTDP-glucose 4,6-dehydratase